MVGKALASARGCEWRGETRRQLGDAAATARKALLDSTAANANKPAVTVLLEALAQLGEAVVAAAVRQSTVSAEPADATEQSVDGLKKPSARLATQLECGKLLDASPIFDEDEDDGSDAHPTSTELRELLAALLAPEPPPEASDAARLLKELTSPADPQLTAGAARAVF